MDPIIPAVISGVFSIVVVLLAFILRGKDNVERQHIRDSAEQSSKMNALIERMFETMKSIEEQANMTQGKVEQLRFRMESNISMFAADSKQREERIIQLMKEEKRKKE